MPNDQTDWARVDAMSDEEAEANALSDPDNPPLTSEQLRAAPRMPQVKVIRRAVRLTQEEFSARYQIPIGTLRDWEHGRSMPDQTARAYLKVDCRQSRWYGASAGEGRGVIAGV